MTTFYRVFSGRGRAALADMLGAEDPFGVEPAEIVARVLALGSVPDLLEPRSDPWPTVGAVFEVHDADGRDFLVTIGRDAEEIAVQEVVAEAYPSE